MKNETAKFKEPYLFKAFRKRFPQPTTEQQAKEYLQSALKRKIDIASALALMPFATPLILSAAAINKLLQPMEPAFYTAERIAKNGKRIKIAKIRTLKSTPTGEKRPSEIEHSRRYWWGSFMKRTRIDELPQLTAILSGELSFVGTRVIAQWDQERIKQKAETGLIDQEQCNNWINHYNEITPGCTNLTYNLNCNNQTTAQRIRLDNFYATHANWKLDLYTMFLLTPYTLITGRGINKYQ